MRASDVTRLLMLEREGLFAVRTLVPLLSRPLMSLGIQNERKVVSWIRKNRARR